MLLMRLKNFNYLISLLVFFLSSSFLWSEEKIDIWKNNTNNDTETSNPLSKEIKSAFDQKFIVDHLVEEINVNAFDALAIPGGFKDYHYYDDAFHPAYLNLIQRFNDQNKWIASVCVGALPVAKSGVLQHKNGSTYFSYRNELESYGVNICDQPIVIDQHIITSCGPSTAIEVAFILLEKVTDQKNTKKVRRLMGF